VKLVAVILTRNEAHHLARCIASVRSVVSDIVVVDCHSTDATREIAANCGAKVLQRAWVNYATQFNWALGQLDTDTDWVLRIDADEYLTPALQREIRERLDGLGDDVDGVVVGRRMTFQGRLLRHGGLFPVQVLRLFRFGRGRCENRWMDEHIKVSGRVVRFKGELIDDNLNSLTWWTEKHNQYASREAVDLLNLDYGFMPADSVASLRKGGQAGFKRWLKERVYARMPGGLRACIYFFYRYVLRLGFLDGAAGARFHVLQGFWYRYLVDAKVAEVRRCMRDRGLGAVEAIREVLEIDVAPSEDKDC
jgi:glycosyltransferase involved in cell wall biosynthesis